MHLANHFDRSKNGKNKPKTVHRVGKEDKLIKDYLEVYEEFKRFLDRSCELDISLSKVFQPENLTF